ncbi:hypothetical protein BD770DRAFT_412521 [Pilaira anomala]|nr:hypothetical protein BD770DRAFT_412521 [Pilaira anomala]
MAQQRPIKMKTDAMVTEQSKCDEEKHRQAMAAPKNNTGKTYVIWDKQVSESDKQTPLDHLMDFLLNNSGEYIKKYQGHSKINDVKQEPKVNVINDCTEYFKSVGVEISSSSVKSKTGRLLEHTYHKAYAEYIKNDSGGAGGNTEKIDKKFEEKLNKICPRFFEMKEIIGVPRKAAPRKAVPRKRVPAQTTPTQTLPTQTAPTKEAPKKAAPFVINSSQPFNSVDIYEGKTSEDERDDDSDSTDYYTTDEDKNSERNWNSSTSSNSKKRRYNSLDELIKADARESYKRFMNNIEALRTKAIEDENALYKKKMEYKKKIDLVQLQVRAFMKSNGNDRISDTERIKKIDEIHSMYFNDNN